ncbi:MAG: cell division protein FtsZ [Chloroflexi bacterium]|nr:cell division protein FtsZ [Chloroflexota bacterium]
MVDSRYDLGSTAEIKVVGVGGGGSNAVDRMIEVGVRGVEFIALNTDGQALANSQAPIRVRLGDKATRGLGCGGDPQLGERAAEESADRIRELLQGADMVFVTAGMGGGTGTGGAPIVAGLAKEVGALTVSVVTKPFGFEGGRRASLAAGGISRLREKVDTLVVIPNDRLLQVIDPRATVKQAFLAADDLPRQGIQGVSDLITGTGLVNVDFNDVRSIMGNGGSALMAIGTGVGEQRAVDAAVQAVNSQLLDISIDGARGVLYNIKGGSSMTLAEVNDAAEVIRKMVDPEANIIFGATVDQSLEDEIQITVIATGFDGQPKAASAGRAVTSSEPSGAAPRTRVVEIPAQSNAVDDWDIPPFLRQKSRRR